MRKLSNKRYSKLQRKIKSSLSQILLLDSVLVYCNSIDQIEFLTMLGLFNSNKTFDPDHKYIILLNSSACDTVSDLDYAKTRYVKYKIFEFKDFLKQFIEQ